MHPLGRVQSHRDDGMLLHLPSAGSYELSQAENKLLLPDAVSDFPHLMAELTTVAAAIGGRDFYEVALAALGRFLNCERQIAVRYAQFAKPQFVVNKSISTEAEAVYMRDLYRLDPLLRLVRTEVRERVLTSLQLHCEEKGNVYFEDLYRSAGIYDELIVLLPAVGGVWVALCLDVSSRPFSAGEVAFVRYLYPLMEHLHRLHIDGCLFGRRGGYLNDSHLAVMVLDCENFACFRNAVWTRNMNAAAEQSILSVSRGSREGIYSLNETDVVHWEGLDRGNAIAPGGRVFVVERSSPGYLDIGNFLKRISSDYRLTPRECEIIRLGLRGLSTAAIAKRLAIGSGTVRNHKHRLYHKLRVTSEREIASLIFARIFEGSMS